jgi:hypothetical protein
VTTDVVTQLRGSHARLAAALGTDEFELCHGDDTRDIAIAADRIAFAAAIDDEAGWRRLGVERWLLERWQAAGIAVPIVLDEDVTRRVQVRTRLDGITGSGVEAMVFGCDPVTVDRYAATAPLSPFGLRLAESYGELSARIRRAVAVDDAAAAGLVACPGRGLDVDLAIAKLAAVAPRAIADRARRARDWLVAVPPIDACIHADLHFHNVVLAADGAIVGVFDVGDAGLDCAAAELLYVHSLGPRFVATTVAACGEVDLTDVGRAHVRTALGHVLCHGPGKPRHAAAVAWASDAIVHLT